MTEPDRLDVLEGPESSLLDLLDNLLNQGVVVSGEVILGLAGVDLIYLRLSAVLCAADKLLPHLTPKPRAPEPRK
ncbi:MAG TPA: gas vesicle protein GvpJ [Thermoanaerobaculia bacterium]|nr:gas vesicle protein GvpJ [Thermoanaerobaculia bacterium]